MKRYFLIALLSILVLNSCGSDAQLDSQVCPPNILCTEELRFLTYSPKVNNQPLILDNYYVKNLDNGNVYQDNSLNSQMDDGQYFIISDAHRGEVQKEGTTLRFFGIKDNQIAIETDFLVGHDCCHIIPLSGPFDE